MCNIVHVLSYKLLSNAQKCALWGYDDLDLWPSKSNWFILKSSGQMCKNKQTTNNNDNKPIQVFMRYDIHKNGMEGQTENPKT